MFFQDLLSKLIANRFFSQVLYFKLDMVTLSRAAKNHFWPDDYACGQLGLYQFYEFILVIKIAARIIKRKNLHSKMILLA